MSLFSHKRGDTFDYAGTLTLPAGTWTARSMVRRKNKVLVAELTATLENPAGGATAVRLFHDDTTAWPLETLKFDVQFDDAVSGEVLSTDTVAFRMVEDVTYDDPG